MGKRHLTPKEIMAHCKFIAKEKRTAERSPWTVASILASYTMLKCEGFKGQKINKVLTYINELEAQRDAGKVDLEELRTTLAGYGDLPIGYVPYTEADITKKKGSFDYYMDYMELDAQNTINEVATRYIVFFFTALIHVYGYGRTRLKRVADFLNNLLTDYQGDRKSLREWKAAILDEAGILIEPPVDPLTQDRTSTMMGDY